MDKIFRIDEAFEKYAPHMTRYGEQYNMDQTTVALLMIGGFI